VPGVLHLLPEADGLPGILQRVGEDARQVLDHPGQVVGLAGEAIALKEMT
jgi:hypothetical protein